MLISEPRPLKGGGFILVHYAGKRRKRDPAYLRGAKIFADKDLEELNRLADAAKLAATGLTG